MMGKRPPIGQRSLFETEPHDFTAPTPPPVERPYAHPQLFLGTSAFTANGWVGSFYPAGMKPGDYLGHYAKTFRTVEIDSTYYGTPVPSTIESWYRKTPADFLFAAKVPQVVTHEKMLKDCDAELEEFLEAIGLLKEKLGPLLLQLPRFNQFEFKNGLDFLARLRPFLKRLPERVASNLAIEIRNAPWLDQNLVDCLREHKVSLALTDTSFLPRPWELKKPIDWITADFAYVRCLGNRKEIETRTTTWDKAIVDRTEDLRRWVEFLRRLVAERKLRRLFLFANNHYQGHGPDTIKMFWQLWQTASA
jgi:uncharacterized protein YecE (DUF72 family)